MVKKKKNFIKSLENRIAFYRHCMVWTFLLGLLAGVSILCGKSNFIMTDWSHPQQIGMKVFLCFIVAATGIATGSAYRRRIAHLKEHRDKILLDSCDPQPFPKPVREQVITEIQALFGILFLLVVIIFCIRYPIPKLPDLLDSNPVRVIPLIGFVVLCWISVGLERRDSLIRLNPLQDFVKSQQKRARIRSNRLGIPEAYIAASREFQKGGPSQVHTNRSMQP